MRLETPKTLKQLIRSPNIAEDMTEGERETIAAWVMEGYENDKNSRKQWADNMGEAMKMALQVVTPKSEPWDGASNVRFPLISVAAMHWSARAYPLMVPGKDIVECTTFGPDPDGKKAERARRIGVHMSWQLLEQITEWEEEHDKCLMVMGILGLAIKKSWFDTTLRRNRSMCITPTQLVLNYWAKGPIDMHPRATLEFEADKNECYANFAQGLWCAYEGDDYYDDNKEDSPESIAEELAEGAGQLPEPTPMTEAAEQRTGSEAPMVDSTTPYEMLEQSCWLDLDDDGYAEPYFVVVDKTTQQLRRIFARFNTSDVMYGFDKSPKPKKIVLRITPELCYTAYKLIPSPDGSYYPLGFGRLLGPLDDTCSTAINEMIDAGTLANYGGGFIGRGARLRGGQLLTNPGEWHSVDVIGGSLRDNMVPFPNNEPSNVLFSLVQFLVQYAERLASANDLQMGESVGQNTPAQTAQTMNENGGRVFGGMFKRAWRSLRDEVAVFYSLNVKYIKADADFPALTTGAGALLLPDDYFGSSVTVRPAADPDVISEETKRQRDSMVMQTSLQIFGFNRYQAVLAWLKTNKVPNIDRLLPEPQLQPGQQGAPDLPIPPNIAMMGVQVKQGELANNQQKTQLAAKKIQNDLSIAISKLQIEAKHAEADITMLQGKAVYYLNQAKGVDQAHQIALVDAMIGARKQHLDGLIGIIDSMTNTHKVMNDNMKELSDASNSNAASATQGAGVGPTPGLVGPPANAGLFSTPRGGTLTAPGGMG